MLGLRRVRCLGVTVAMPFVNRFLMKQRDYLVKKVEISDSSRGSLVAPLVGVVSLGRRGGSARR